MLIPGERGDFGHGLEGGGQFLGLHLGDNVHVNGQAPDGIKAEEEAGAAFELDREAGFGEVAQKLEGDYGLLKHDGVAAPVFLCFSPNPLVYKALTGNHWALDQLTKAEFFRNSALICWMRCSPAGRRSRA